MGRDGRERSSSFALESRKKKNVGAHINPPPGPARPGIENVGTSMQ